MGPLGWQTRGVPRSPPPNRLTSRACCSSWARSSSRGGTGSSSSTSCTATSAPPLRDLGVPVEHAAARGGHHAPRRRRRAARRGGLGPGGGRRSPSGCGMCPASSRCASRCGWPRRPRRSSAAAVALTEGTTGDVRGAGPAQGQALPADLSGAGRAGRAGDPGGARAGGQPVPPGHHGLHRGRPGRGVRLHRGPGRAGRAAGGDERPRVSRSCPAASTRRWPPTG